MKRSNIPISGGSPTPCDHSLVFQFGALAAQLAHQDRSMRMVMGRLPL
jgi:hypothetical protein